MFKNKLIIVVKYSTEDLTLIRLGNAVGEKVESAHDFLVLPAYSNRCQVCAEQKNVLGKAYMAHHNLSPTYEINSFIHAFHHNEEGLDDDELDEVIELQNYWNNLRFDDTSALIYKPAWEQLKDADEETFILNLLKSSVKGMETCDIEVGDCGAYSRVTVEYDIEIPEGEDFDIKKLDFFGVDAENLDCWEKLSIVFTQPRADLFLDTIIYDGKVYTGKICTDIIPNSCIEHIAVETLTEFNEI